MAFQNDLDLDHPDAIDTELFVKVCNSVDVVMAQSIQSFLLNLTVLEGSQARQGYRGELPISEAPRVLSSQSWILDSRLFVQRSSLVAVRTNSGASIQCLNRF